MTRTTIQRWTIATLGFIGIAVLDVRYGHSTALVTLLALMLLVALYGGSGYGNKSHVPKSGVPEAQDQDETGADAGSKTAKRGGSTTP
jgi:hypothetical protein